MSCSHVEKCTECAYAHFAYKKLLKTSNADEKKLRAEFNDVSPNEHPPNTIFICINCGNETANSDHIACLICVNDYCSTCSELHTCHICNNIGCAFCVPKCSLCGRFTCYRCYDKRLSKDCSCCAR